MPDGNGGAVPWPPWPPELLPLGMGNGALPV